MGEKSETTAPAVVATEEVVAVPAAEKPTSTAAVKETLSVPEAEPENPSAAVVEAEAEKPKEEAGETAAEEKITESASFKEESNVAGELPDPEKKALDELKLLIQEALNKHEFTAPPPPPPAKEEEKPAEVPAAETEVEKIVEKSEAPAETPAVETTPAAAAPPPPVETKAEEKESTPPPPLPAAEPSEEKAATPPPPPPAAEPSSEKAATPPPPPPAAEPSSVTTVVDEDGAKTVEAIKETIIEVPAAAAVPPPEEAPLAEPAAAAVSEETPAAAAPPPPPEEVSIWGIRLLADEKSDVVLLKFLRARDFKVKDAFTMIKNTVRWQKEFGIEALLEEEEEEFGADLEKVVFMSGFDKEGHPVCYNAYGEFQNKELYQKIFADEEKREKFLGWRIRFLEKSIRKLDFSPDGISTIVQVNDLKNSPGPFKRELRLATNQALQLLQDNYPEFVAKQVFINVPWWYLAFYRMISPFFTLRSKSKFVFAGPSKSAETLFKYIAPEQVPVQYGGLSREGEQEFTTTDAVTEDTIKPTSKHTIEFPVSEKSVLVWETRVVGWDVSYGAEFVPSAVEGYTVIVQKSTKITPADEPIISNSFKVTEPGKVVLTFDNQTSKKKKLLYRSKTKPSE